MLIALYLAIAALWLWRGLGAGPRGSACADTSFPNSGGAGSGHVARAGAALSAGGNIQACALHPSLGQWALYLLTRLPGIALMTPTTFSGGEIAIDIVVVGRLKALLPVPAIAGAALLSFARITQAGAVLDEEIKATV